MTMDYGSSVDNGGAMGTDAIDAIQATEKQLAGIGLAAKIGVTPLIGVNDVTSEVFSLADAQQLMSYVATDPDVVRVAMWSLGRDNGSTAGQDADVPTGSGIAQTNYEFSQIFDAPVSATLARLAQAAASLGGTSGAAATSPSVAVADTAATTTLAPNPLKH